MIKQFDNEYPHEANVTQVNKENIDGILESDILSFEPLDVAQISLHSCLNTILFIISSLLPSVLHFHC